MQTLRRWPLAGISSTLDRRSHQTKGSMKQKPASAGWETDPVGTMKRLGWRTVFVCVFVFVLLCFVLLIYKLEIQVLIRWTVLLLAARALFSSWTGGLTKWKPKRPCGFQCEVSKRRRHLTAASKVFVSCVIWLCSLITHPLLLAFAVCHLSTHSSDCVSYEMMGQSNAEMSTNHQGKSLRTPAVSSQRRKARTLQHWPSKQRALGFLAFCTWTPRMISSRPRLSV